MYHKKLPLLILLLLTTIFFSLASAALFGNHHKGNGERKSIWDLLVLDGRFKTLILHIEDANLTTTFKNINHGTVFAPVNEAFDDDGKVIAQRKLTADQLLYHVLPVAVESDELWDGKLLDTHARIDDVNQKLKVTTSFKSIFLGTDNDGQDQSKIIEPDMDASNGVIHLVDKVIHLPLYLDETLSQNEDTRQFYELAKKSRISQELKNARESTVFVAKGDFFGDDFDAIERNYLTEHHEGRKDLARFLKHQIAPKIYYTTDMAEGKSAVPTVEQSEDLEVVVEKNNKIFPNKITINGVEVTHRDIIAANGVIHVLKKPLLPKNKDFIKLTARKILTGMNSSHFINLFDENGLGDYLDDDRHNVTILAPPNDAFDKKIAADRNVKSWLRYHIIHGRFTPADLHNGQILETESHDRLGPKDYQRILVHIQDQARDYVDNYLVKQSILFGKSGVLSDPVEVGRNLIIYPIRRPLALPREPLKRLPTNLDLSTFVASIYASNADEAISETEGITLFAPNNEGFGRLGLLAKYLLQPEAKEKLKQVVSFHAVRGLFYTYSTKEGELRVPTLASDDDLLLNKTKDGFFVRGSGAADGSDRNVIAKVVESDILTSNGVIHTIDRVQMPSSLEITNRNLLSAEGTDNLLGLLERAKLTEKVLEGLDKDKPYTILAPTDNAFGRVNFTQLLDDHDKLLKIARLHVLPIGLPRLDMGSSADNSFDYYNIFNRKYKKNDDDHAPPEVPYIGVDIPTLLDDDYVVISKSLTGTGYSVKVKGTFVEGANIVNLGRATNGGGVLVIDRVLIPKEIREQHGLPWWAIALIVIGSLIGAAILAVAIYLGWRYYQSRREGGVHLPRDD